MKALYAASALAFLAGAAPVRGYHVELSRYFTSAGAEVQARAQLTADVTAFIAAPTPVTAAAMRAWLDRYDDLLRRLFRHDDYLYLKSEENQDDTGDGKLDDAVGTLEDRLGDRVVRAAGELGAARVAALAPTRELARYRYLLRSRKPYTNQRRRRVESSSSR